MIYSDDLALLLPMRGDNTIISPQTITVESNVGEAYTTGKPGGCRSFDGTDDVLEVSVSGGNVMNSSGGVTIACWAKNDSDGSVFQPIWGNTTGKSSNHTEGVRCYFTADGRLFVRWHGPTYATHNKITEYNCSTGTWYHIVGCWDGTNGGDMNLYVNGVLEDTATANYTRGDDDEPMILAKRRDESQYGDVHITDFCIFNKVLSLTDIRRLMSGFHPIS